MATSWSVVDYAGLDGLMQLKSEWTRLVDAMPDAGFEHLHETHVSCLAKIPSAFGTLHCLALSDGERIRAICPVDQQEFPVFRFFKSPTWGMLRGCRTFRATSFVRRIPKPKRRCFPVSPSTFAVHARGDDGSCSLA